MSQVADRFLSAHLRAGQPIEDRRGLLSALGDILNVGLLRAGIESVLRRQNADENQDNQAHTLLPVVGTVKKADCGTGEEQESANQRRGG